VGRVVFWYLLVGSCLPGCRVERQPAEMRVVLFDRSNSPSGEVSCYSNTGRCLHPPGRSQPKLVDSSGLTESSGFCWAPKRSSVVRHSRSVMTNRVPSQDGIAEGSAVIWIRPEDRGCRPSRSQFNVVDPSGPAEPSGSQLGSQAESCQRFTAAAL